MKSLSDRIKSILTVGLVLSLGIVSAMRLMEIQVVGDETIAEPDVRDTDETFVYTVKTAATRGEIMDFSGELIVSNTTSTNIILRKAFFPEENQEGNRILLQIYNELRSCGYTIETSIPVSMNSPYYFTDDEAEAELKADLNLNVYATAENCIDKLISDYEISDSYSDTEKRIIAGLRYEMLYKDFALTNDFVLAKDVDSDTIIRMKELSNVLKGVDAVESATREILRGDILPHEIGTVGPIYAEEYAELKDEGYELNDVLGKSGVEAAMEKLLRGQNGEEEITVTNGSIVDIQTLSEAQSGQSVRLTVDDKYQLRVQAILDNFIANFQSINKNPDLDDVHSGAIVVLDAKTGALKAAATAPTYNLLDYIEDYDSILNAEHSPLFNRATDGLYRPGSTFKTITATAGLNEGIVTGDSTFRCTRKYQFIDTPFQCTGHHNDIAVTRAIEVSCNIYFYELAQRLGIDKITEYSQLFGLGQHTGLETGDAAGYLANPETFVANGQNWYVGYVLQAAIGNIDCGMTPLQMACVASTLANDGVRYQPYLIDSYYTYGTNELISKTQPTIAEKIDLNYDYVFDYIENGMIAASHNMPAKYSLSNLGFDVAIKTGTPQVGENGEQNSFFIGYAPAHDPQIAFAGVIEGGEYSKYMIRDIITSYMECYGFTESAPSSQEDGTSADNTQPVTAGDNATDTAATEAPTQDNPDAPNPAETSAPEQNTDAPVSDAPEDASLPPETPEVEPTEALITQ